MVNGAGLAMATMDIIKIAGGMPANFLDVGGGANAQTVEAGFKIILKDPNVKAILINIFGGIVRCDRVAEGVVEAAKNVEVQIPIVIRLAGTNAELAAEILQKSGLRFLVARDLQDADGTSDAGDCGIIIFCIYKNTHSMSWNEIYEPVIGLEVHAQLLTQSKAFCSCSTKFGNNPNSNVCPVCLGMPGVLPVLNKQVVDFTIRMGLATHCTMLRNPYLRGKIISILICRKGIKYRNTKSRNAKTVSWTSNCRMEPSRGSA